MQSNPFQVSQDNKLLVHKEKAHREKELLLF